MRVRFIMNKLFIKSVCLNSFLYAEYVKIEKAIYIWTTKQESDVQNDNLLSYERALEFQILYRTRYPRLYKECKRIYKARLSRVSRLKKRVSKMLNSGQCVFLTFTFVDGALKNLSAQTRKDYVRRFLNDLQCPYVGNIDFGKTNGREHYHALVQNNYVSYTDWLYGNLDGIKVRIGADDTDVAKISRYIAKLTNHAIKETAKNSYILYSRKFK